MNGGSLGILLGCLTGAEDCGTALLNLGLLLQDVLTLAVGIGIVVLVVRSERARRARRATPTAPTAPMAPAAPADPTSPTDPAASAAAPAAPLPPARRPPPLVRWWGAASTRARTGVAVAGVVLVGLYLLGREDTGGQDGSVTAAEQDEASSADDAPTGAGDWIVLSHPQGLRLSVPAGWAFDDALATRLAGPGSGLVAVAGPDAAVVVWPLFVPGDAGPSDPALLLDRLAGRLWPGLFPAGRAVDAASARTEASDGATEHVALVTLAPSAVGTAATLHYAVAADLTAASPVVAAILASVRVVGAPVVEGAAGPQFVPVTDADEAAFTVDVPAGWGVEARLHRVATTDYRPTVLLSSPDGRTVIVWSGFNGAPFLERYAVTGLIIHGPGDVVTGYDGTRRVIRDVVGTDVLLRETVEPIAQFAQCGPAAVTGVAPAPELAQAVGRNLNGSVVRGTYDAARLDLTCGDRVGRLLGVTEVLGYAQADPTLSGQPVLWGMQSFAAWVAPAGQEALAQTVIARLYGTFAFDPGWFARQLGTEASLGEVITRTGRDISEIVSRGYEGQQGTLDALSQRRSDATLGIERVDDPVTGRTYAVEAGSNYYWVDDRGTVVGTDVATAPTVDFRALIGP